MPSPLHLHYPVAGRWLVRNSPVNRVPSHGTAMFGLAYAIDFVPVDGTVIQTHDSEPDHGSYRGLPSIGYTLTQRRRLARGVFSVIGNHVLLETRYLGNRTAIVALCHLQQHSITVRPGQRVSQSETIGRCGNSGNSTEPHLHLHALDRPDLLHGTAVPISFDGDLPRNGEIVGAG